MKTLALLGSLILVMGLLACAPETSYKDKNFGAFNDFFQLSRERADLLFPEVQRGSYQKEFAITENDFKNLFSLRECSSKPQRNPKLTPGTNQIWFNTSLFYDYQFNFKGRYFEIEHIQMIKGNEENYHVNRSFLEGWLNYARISHVRDRFDLIEDSREGYLPFYFLVGERLENRMSEFRGFPKVGDSFSVREMFEQIEQGIDGSIFDGGTFTLADGQKLRAYRGRFLMNHPTEPSAWEYILSSDVGWFGDALCRYARIRQSSVDFRRANGRLEIFEAPFEMELLSNYQEAEGIE